MPDDSPQGPPPPRPRRFGLVAAAAWAGAWGGVAALAYGWFWPAGLGPAGAVRLGLDHAAFLGVTFAFHIAAGAAGCAALLCVLGRARIIHALLAAGAIGGCGWALRPRAPEPPAGRPTLTIMSVNLLYGSGDTESLLGQIRRERPDILVFQEYTPRSEVLRRALEADYPHVAAWPQEDAFGQAVFSRLAFESPARVVPPGFDVPQISVVVAFAGRRVGVTSVHLYPPVSGAMIRGQREQAALLAAYAAERLRDGEGWVLAGDFNAPCGSAHLRRLGEAGFRDAHTRAGGGLGATWPRTGSLRWAPGVRIDHVLYSRDLDCVGARTGEDFGSDHRPVIARLVWR